MVDIRFRYKVALSCIVVMMVFVTMSGFSYAYFTAEVTGTGRDVTVTTEGVNLTYTAGGTNINLTNAVPLADSEGLKKDPYTFSLKNNNTYGVRAYIYVSVDKNSTLAPENIRVAYAKSGESISEATTPFDLTEKDSQVVDQNAFSASYLLDTVDIDSNGSMENFQLLLWIKGSLNEIITCNGDEGDGESISCAPDENSTMGKTFNAIVTVKTEPNRDATSTSSGEPVASPAAQGAMNEPEIFDNPQEIQNTQPEVTTPSVEENGTPENTVPNGEQEALPNENEVQNGEGMEGPSVE